MSIEYKKIVWEIVPSKTPVAIRNCPKCKKKSKFVCSELFRVNANKDKIDVWLIFRCAKCSSTWNETILSRTSKKLIERGLYQKFLSNDKETAWKYCFDAQVMRKNNVKFEYGGIEYIVEGADADIESMMKTGCEITIESKYRFDPRLDTLLKEKLGLSKKLICELADSGCITLHNGADIRKHRIKDETVVFVSKAPGQDSQD
jgi:hypothetical protein